MTEKNTRRIVARKWVLLGSAAATVVGSAAMATPVPQPTGAEGPVWVHPAANHTAAATEGGEGGEGGEAGHASAASTEAQFLSDLGFMQGHALVGLTLYSQGDTDTGTAHAGHPIGEKYDDVEEELQERGLGQLRDQLVALSDAAADGKPVEEVQARYDDVVATIDQARASAEGGAVNELMGLAHLTRVAADEYAEAFEGGDLSNPVEYQDAWGFFHVVRSEAERLAASDDPKIADAAKKFLVFAEEAAPAFGQPDGSGIATIDPSLIYGAAAKMEFAALAAK